MRNQPFFLASAIALALCLAPLGHAEKPAAARLLAPASGVVGVTDAQLSPEFWLMRLPSPNQPLLDRAAIDGRNALLFQSDKSMHDLNALPASLERAQVAGWIGDLASPPSKALWL